MDFEECIYEMDTGWMVGVYSTPPHPTPLHSQPPTAGYVLFLFQAVDRL
jgi:hypothetical protein